jgi:Reverse transcriptase (RNA-dependent DNA polymerase)
MSKLSKLIGQGYLPAELPPPFKSTSLAKAFPSVSTLGGLVSVAAPTKFVSKPSTHSLARVGAIRRTLSIPNPVSYLYLAESIATNWHVCRTISSPRSGVLSTPVLHQDSPRAVSWLTSFSNLSEEVIRARAGMRFTLQTDIARFYPSLYTHSLSWAIHGKDRAKEKGFGNKYEYFGNELDVLSRNAQDRQTVGIPIGPDTSLVLAELVLSRLDRHLEKKGIKGNRVRYIDDIEISFGSRIEAEEAIVQLEEFLALYELTLNPLKTEIIELPEPVELQWVSRLRRFNFKDGPIKKADLIDFLSSAFTESKNHKGRSVLSYALSRLDKTELSLNRTDWPVFEGLIYQCMAVEAGCIRIATKLLCKFALRRFSVDPEKLAHTVESVLSHGLSHAHGSEVAWAIWLAICFKVPIKAPIAEKLSRSNDSVVRVIALHAQQLGLIRDLNTDSWRQDLVKDSLTDEKWLFAYESNVKNWLSPTTGGDFVGVNAIFKQLKTAGVHFYDVGEAQQFRNALENQDFSFRDGLFKWLAVEPSSYELKDEELDKVELPF